MKVILIESVPKIGRTGEVVNVKEGYARNFLLPHGKALRVNAANMARFEAEKSQMEARNLETKKDADALAAKLNGQKFVVIRSASDAGSLYGSVTTRDAADAAIEAGFSVDKKQVVLTGAIKELGLHDVVIHLHPEVEATITLNVARSVEEAELQEAGKSIAELAAEEEAAAEFEIQELFDDIGAAAMDDLLDESEPAIPQEDAVAYSLGWGNAADFIGADEVFQSGTTVDKDQQSSANTGEGQQSYVTLQDYVERLSDIQKLEISATSGYIHETLQAISNKEKKIGKMLERLKVE